MVKANTAVKPHPPIKPPMPNGTALAIGKRNPQALIRPTSDDLMAELGGMASDGLENVTANDVIIPRLTILQALSPQVTKSKPEFIKGAEQGNFCDTGTNEIFVDSISVIPCFFARVFLEWAPRATGRGLVKNHGIDASILDQCTPDEKGRQIMPNGNLVAETATYYVLNMSAGGRRSFIPMSSTQLRAARRWMTVITAEKGTRADGSQFTPPIFYRQWEASPVEQTNPEGNWYGWKFEAGLALPQMDDGKHWLNEAKAFYEQVRSGAVVGDVVSAVGDDASVNAGAM